MPNRNHGLKSTHDLCMDAEAPTGKSAGWERWPNALELHSSYILMYSELARSRSFTMIARYIFPQTE